MEARQDGTPGVASASSADYDVAVERGVMVPMRDGVRLATDIYWPAIDGQPAPGSHPALLHRTPYDKIAVERRFRYSEWFARRGYVSLMQDVRGTFASEGEFEFLAAEAHDGVDALAWIDEQPWTNGMVGSWGTSYASFTQLAMATQKPPNLKAIVPNQSAVNAWKSSVRQGGAFELRFLGWALWHSATNARLLRDDPHLSAALNLGAPTMSDWLTRLPIRKGETQLKLTPSYEQWVLRLITESDYTDYWKQPSFAPELYFDAFPDMDMLIMGGWYDSYPRSTLEAFEQLSRRGRGRVHVLVGPWVHGTAKPETAISGDLDFGPAAAIPDLRELHLRWFDHAVKGLDTGVTQDPPVRIWVMGGGGGHRTAEGKLFHGGRWRDEQRWPLSRTRFTDYYLHADGLLSPEKPGDSDSATTYRFDPAAPVPSIGGSVSSLADLRSMPPGISDTEFAGGSVRYADVMQAGGHDQVEAPGVFGCSPPYLPLSSRPDVLVFRTAGLSEDVEVTGPISVRLWVSSSAPDTDFTAKLIDEYPPSEWYPMGYALNLSDSIIRLRYRNGGAQDLLAPGDVAEVTITLYPTSNVFCAGHRIRLDVSSSNFPRFDVNPNTGEPLGMERRRAAADNTVHHSASRPSSITLPIIPAESEGSQGAV